METYRFPHAADPLQEVHLALFRHISHGGELRQRLIQAASMQGAEGDTEREDVNFAFIDAALISSKEQILTAVHQAIISASRGAANDGNVGGMKTSNIHGEIIFALMPGTNIGESLRTFGISPQTSDLLVIRVTASTQGDAAARSSLLYKMAALAQAKPDTQGLQQSLSATADLTRIKKAYKLQDVSFPSEPSDKLRDLIVSTIAMKSVAA